MGCGERAIGCGERVMNCSERPMGYGERPIGCGERAMGCGEGTMELFVRARTCIRLFNTIIWEGWLGWQDPAPSSVGIVGWSSVFLCPASPTLEMAEPFTSYPRTAWNWRLSSYFRSKHYAESEKRAVATRDGVPTALVGLDSTPQCFRRL